MPLQRHRSSKAFAQCPRFACPRKESSAAASGPVPLASSKNTAFPFLAWPPAFRSRSPSFIADDPFHASRSSPRHRVARALHRAPATCGARDAWPHPDAQIDCASAAMKQLFKSGTRSNPFPSDLAKLLVGERRTKATHCTGSWQSSTRGSRSSRVSGRNIGAGQGCAGVTSGPGPRDISDLLGPSRAT